MWLSGFLQQLTDPGGSKLNPDYCFTAKPEPACETRVLFSQH